MKRGSSGSLSDACTGDDSQMLKGDDWLMLVVVWHSPYSYGSFADCENINGALLSLRLRNLSSSHIF